MSAALEREMKDSRREGEEEFIAPFPSIISHLPVSVDHKMA